MQVQKIYSKNATYQKFEVLKTNRNKRHKYNEFFVEGVRNINEAIKSDFKICSFLYTKEKSLSDWAENILLSVETDINYELTMDLMQDLSNKEDTSELLAIVTMQEDSFSRLNLSSNPVLALFDCPSNHGNLGTIIRSCDSLGIEALIITGHAVDLYDSNVISASMGSFFTLPVIRVPDNDSIFSFFEDMKKTYENFQIVATSAHSETNIFDIDLKSPTLIMLGNETNGLCRAFKENCDILASIPMHENSSASSFNVACAATVLFYEIMRQRI